MNMFTAFDALCFPQAPKQKFKEELKR